MCYTSALFFEKKKRFSRKKNAKKTPKKRHMVYFRIRKSTVYGMLLDLNQHF